MRFIGFFSFWISAQLQVLQEWFCSNVTTVDGWWNSCASLHNWSVCYKNGVMQETWLNPTIRASQNIQFYASMGSALRADAAAGLSHPPSATLAVAGHTEEGSSD